MHQPLHEAHLVEAGRQEKAGELREALFTEIAPPVEIVSASLITRCEVALVGTDVARQASSDRPDCTRVERIEQRRMRHQPRDTAVAVEERVNPQQPVMRRRRRENRFRFAKAAIGFLETPQEARYGWCADSDVAAHRNIPLTQFPWNDLYPLMRHWIFDPEQVVRQGLAKVAVNLENRLYRDHAALEPSFVNPLLDGNMRPRFELQIALLGVLAVVALEGTLDIDRVRVVPFN